MLLFSNTKLIKKCFNNNYNIYKCISNTLINLNQKSKPIIRNEGIRAKEVRVLHNNKDEILSRKAALDLAKSLKLDLILVNAAVVPPVCKIENYSQMARDYNLKKMEAKRKQKSLSKEIHIGANIDPHDLGIKMRKINELLEDGCHVKLSIFATKQIMESKPLAIDETTLRVLDELEKIFNGPIVPSSKAVNRVDFMLAPKKPKPTPK